MFNKRDYLDKQLNTELDNPKFMDYYQYLIEINKQINLTRITDLDDVYYKHFYDSIILSKHLNLQNKSLLDVGSGAGFPSLPLKIINGSLSVSIIDSLKKRIGFLEKLTEKLRLENIELIHGRAEELKRLNQYDIVTSRAVARMNILAEITLPFVKIGGYFVAYKSINYEAELEEAKSAIKILGGQIEETIKYQISEDEEHVLIFVKKIKNTSNIYPRHFSKIKNNPL